MRRSSALAAAFGAAVVAAAALAGEGAMQGRDGPAARGPAFVVVGETYGWLEPCGCTEGMLGGLARRAAYVKSLRERGYEPIVLDLGDIIREPGPQSELKLDAIARAYPLLGVKAIAAGERDLIYLERLRAAGFPILLPGEKLDLKTSRGFVTVRALAGPSLRAHFEAAAVTEVAVPAEGPLADVVLFHGRRDEARALAGRAKVVISGHEEEYPAKAEEAGGTLFLSPGDKGKYASVFALPGTVIDAAFPLSDRVADDPGIAKIVDEYKDRLFEENLVEAADRKPPETGGTFVGAETCSACHPKQFAVFETTKHFRAFESLAPRKGTRDPECLSCHSTGSGFTSGFASPERTPDLARVSCESCHGVGSNHVRNPQPGFGAIKEPRKLCVECHDKENSPRFDFDKYWPKIKH